MKIRNAKKKSVKVPGSLPVRLSAAKSVPRKKSSARRSAPSVKDVLAWATVQADAILGDPIYRMSYSRIWSGEFERDCGTHKISRESELMFSHILGMDAVVYATIPKDVLAKIIAVVLYRFGGMIRGVVCRSSIIEDYLNGSTSRWVTPVGMSEFADGINWDSRVYFKYDLWLMQKGVNSDDRTGRYLIISDNGAYCWSYRYQLEPGIWRQYKKNLKTRVRFLPVVCKFEKVSLAMLESWITEDTSFFLDLIHKIKECLQDELREFSRRKMLVQESLNLVMGIISRIAR